MSVHYSDDLVTLHQGDCVEVMRELPEASVDAVVTDPRAVIAHRYSINDIDRWPASVVHAFYQHLRTKEEHA